MRRRAPARARRVRGRARAAALARRGDGLRPGGRSGGTSGALIGIAINHNPEPYGTGTKRANSYRWVDAPNPGGLPTVGNLAFSLTVNASPAAPIGSVFVLSAGRDDRVVLGARVLVDLVAPAVLLPIPSAPRMTVPVGIPSAPALRGLQLFAQTLHADAGGLASSNGIAFTIL